MATGRPGALSPPGCGQSVPALPEERRRAVHTTGRDEGKRMSLSSRDADFSMFPPPGGLGENRLHVRQDAPAGSCSVDARQPPHPGRGARKGGHCYPGRGTKKRSPGSRASHHASRKGERYQRLALKKASILSKGMMSTWSYRSVCEAPGTISSSLLSPLSFLKASSLK